ncbi:uncharacterized protein LOC131896659 isoform X1 [Peromyscus eremicus]|uniref:uncharacterized protein LOC131896659 isoform X1 n=1 Tax=Peromyscus eremicus TaxID=42410 RepID=UPI0027DB9BEA|nr:uncharacterized protein LOC131896659 isoform X1 [Peromyscus eremicus]
MQTGVQEDPGGPFPHARPRRRPAAWAPGSPARTRLGPGGPQRAALRCAPPAPLPTTPDALAHHGSYGLEGEGDRSRTPGPGYRSRQLRVEREHVLLVILLKSLRHSIMIHWWNRRGNVREQCHHCLPYVRLSHPWPKCGAMTAMMINTVSYGMDGGTWDLGPCDISELQEPGTTSSV